MKSIFIIVIFLLELLRNALFCKEFRGFVKCVLGWHLGKTGQDGASYYYLLVVRLVVNIESLLLRIMINRMPL